MSKLRRNLQVWSDRVLSRAWLFLWLMALAHLLTYAFAQTIWSRVDEAQHFHYIQYLAESHVLPVTGQTFISRKVVEVSQAVDQWGWNPPRTVAPPPNLDPQSWQMVPADLQGDERLDWIGQNLWYFSYEAMQPPLYYTLGAVVYGLLPDNPFLEIYVLRAFTAVIVSLTVAIAYATMREAFPDNSILSLGVAATIALLPGFVLNLSQITNDSLATSLSIFCFYLLVRGVRRGLTTKAGALIGLTIGLSLATKLTTVYLIPLALVAVVFASARNLTPLLPVLSKAARSYVALVGTSAAILLPWLLRNWITYGDPTGSGPASGLLGAIFRPVRLSSFDEIQTHLSGSLDHLARTFWFGEPFPPWKHWELAFSAISALSFLALFGLMLCFWRLSRGRSGSQARIVWLMVMAVVFQVSELLIVPVFGGLGVVGRYLYPSVVPAIGLLWLGMLSITREEVHRLLFVILIGGLLALDLLNFVSYLQSSYA